VVKGDGSLTRPESSAASGENREVVRVLEVRAPCKVARLQGRGEVRRGGVCYAPFRVHRVAEPSVCDEPIERCRTLGHGAAWLEEDGLPVVPLYIFKDALSEPFGDDAERGLRRRVVLPGMMVAKDLSLRRGGNFGHDDIDEQAPYDGAGCAVQRAEFLVPGQLSLDQGGDPAFGDDGSSGGGR
jgi:hypothetical protein